MPNILRKNDLYSHPVVSFNPSKIWILDFSSCSEKFYSLFHTLIFHIIKYRIAFFSVGFLHHPTKFYVHNSYLLNLN